jgi:hypothetical protein
MSVARSSVGPVLRLVSVLDLVFASVGDLVDAQRWRGGDRRSAPPTFRWPGKFRTHTPAVLKKM